MACDSSTMFDRQVADSNGRVAVHHASGLARLQQGLMLGSLALAAGWSLWARSWSGPAALLGVLVLLGGYAVVLALLSWTIFNMEDSSNKGVLTMLNMVLLVVPLVSVLFST